MSRRKGVMLAYPFSLPRIEKWVTTIIQPKINGDRCRVEWTPDHVPILRSSEGHEIVSCPHIQGELMNAFSHLENPPLLDGELYIYGTSQYVISGLARRQYSNVETLDLQFHVFDLINDQIQRVRFNRLRSFDILFQQMSHIKRVIGVEVTAPYVNDVLGKCMAEGYEGIICRNPYGLYKDGRSIDMVKCKPRKTDCYLITGYREEVSIHGDPKGRLGSFQCTKDGEDFFIGSGPLLTHQMRQFWWDHRAELIGKWLMVKYQDLTPRGIPQGGSVGIEVLNNYTEKGDK